MTRNPKELRDSLQGQRDQRSAATATQGFWRGWGRAPRPAEFLEVACNLCNSCTQTCMQTQWSRFHWHTLLSSWAAARPGGPLTDYPIPVYSLPPRPPDPLPSGFKDSSSPFRLFLSIMLQHSCPFFLSLPPRFPLVLRPAAPLRTACTDCIFSLRSSKMYRAVANFYQVSPILRLLRNITCNSWRIGGLV